MESEKDEWCWIFVPLLWKKHAQDSLSGSSICNDPQLLLKQTTEWKQPNQRAHTCAAEPNFNDSCLNLGFVTKRSDVELVIVFLEPKIKI